VTKRSINGCVLCSGSVPVCVIHRCMPSLLICCLMLTMPSFFLLSILGLTFCLACLVLAPLANARSRAVRAAFTANIQYFCASIWNPERSVKLISWRKQLSSATSSGAKLDKVSISCMISAAFIIHSMEIPMSPVVERNISVDPLGMCDL
jgi:hypothetical protein